LIKTNVKIKVYLISNKHFTLSFYSWSKLINDWRMVDTYYLICITCVVYLDKINILISYRLYWWKYY
jgi:hypothetical protein